MERKQKTVALLADSVISEYALLLQAAVQRRAARCDADLLTFTGLWLGAPRPLEAIQTKIYDLVTPARVDGVIVVSGTLAHYCGAPGIEALCRGYAPLPVCSIGLAVSAASSLVLDNAAGMELGARHLIEEHGRRRVLFIGGPTNSPEAVERLRGYRAALAHAGLPLDPTLEETGDFTMQGGAAALRRALDRGAKLDALVAANDYMALGAIDVLNERGLKVPEDVAVCGFDDCIVAAFARPALTTLRQPLRTLGTEALDLVLRQVAGEQVPSCTSFPLELVRRESCGCSGQIRETLFPTGPAPHDLREVLAERRAPMLREMTPLLDMPHDPEHAWAGQLLDALGAELSGEAGRFGSVLQELLTSAQNEGVSADGFQRVITSMRASLSGYFAAGSETARRLERHWHHARVLTAGEAARWAGRNFIDSREASAVLGRTGERLSAALSLPVLAEALAEELPALNIRRAAVSLFDEGTRDRLVPLLLMADGRRIDSSAEPIPAEALAPDVALRSADSWHSVVLPLTFETELLGVAVFSATAVPIVYGVLRQAIGAAVKGARLHRQVISQVALRERAEHQNVTKEAQLAVQIQTSINPKDLSVPGLELAASMSPAAEAGGDYYEVIADDGGAWLGIGDVTGHGLGAGLVMLMLQSIISGMVRLDPSATPSRIVRAVNRALYDGVRHRLNRDDHATLALLRYTKDGVFRFAGGHEPFIVYRAKSRKCELVDTTGFWVGAIPDIDNLTVDQELSLEEGDLLVLYTDGLTEPRNVFAEQLGVGRVMAQIEATAHRSALEIRDHLMEAARSWAGSLDDDMTVVVIRYGARPEPRLSSVSELRG